MTVVHSVFKKSAYSQATGVVFAGRNGLDFLELRLGVVRIPDVSLRIREAQAILDSLEVERVDLLSAAITEDDSFFRNIKMKSLLATIVQVGLYDRLLKTQRPPDVLVGNANGDSALLVCAGQITFEQMIKSSSALQHLQPREMAAGTASVHDAASSSNVFSGAGLGLLPGVQAPLSQISLSDLNNSPTLSPGSAPSLMALPSLAGLNLTEYRAYLRTEDSMTEVGQPVMDLKKLLAEVVEHQNVARFVNVGPGAAIANSEYEQIAELASSDEVTVIDSIDLDPMLNWFWKQMRPVLGYAQ